MKQFHKWYDNTEEAVSMMMPEPEIDGRDKSGRDKSDRNKSDRNKNDRDKRSGKMASIREVARLAGWLPVRSPAH